ncbi:hypothetical protein HUB98_24635 [Paenibacillus barcinonensis]|uniref:Uncharacterized protein n=1 Tax=Paenibacillus barcinonensis TaxID=198119 RepID=A0A2V4VSX6_PAEBA|nr:hypothetical protein [Paenibacillus barcinonensis]PYE47822.1 hypothetical protein DFQ00_111121 [Paenibacillus barcinonensis]QKS59077.1 hypothetical protein HUB98_24635 [Paenibacillus barcinonensis]
MDADLINEIQEVLYELITIYELKEYSESVKSFIFPKVKYQNTLWLMPSEIPNHLKNVMWYKLQTKEEIVMALEYTDFWFNCVIVPQGAPPENFNSCLHYTEEHGVEAEDPDGMVLYIQIKDKARFIENTLPKLRYLGHIEVLEEKNRQAEG